jgi:hypothetical protein
MSKKLKQTFEECLQILEQRIVEYKANKTIECYKKLRKACRAVMADTVNPTTPPPTTIP